MVEVTFKKRIGNIDKVLALVSYMSLLIGYRKQWKSGIWVHVWVFFGAYLLERGMCGLCVGNVCLYAGSGCQNRDKMGELCMKF